MSKFKTGDKVRRFRALSNLTPYLNGHEFVLEDRQSDGFWIDPYGDAHNEDNLELALIDEEKAKATLEALGYTITPPKPKQVIEVIMCKDTDNDTVSCVLKRIYDSYTEHSKKCYSIVAIATITEGDGL